MHSPADAYAYLTAIKKILQYLNVSDCNMEEGSLRCDANISLRPVGQKELGTKRELKNMNSFSGVEKALEYEIKHQTEVLSSGGTIVQETLLWDADKNRTNSMRTKEDAHDYRYFPDPDLTPLIVKQNWIDDIQAALPELPRAKVARFIKEYSLSNEHAETLTVSIALANYFEDVVKICKDSKLASSWVMQDILRICKEKKIEVTDLKITPKHLGEIINSIKSNEISAAAGKKVLNTVEESGKDVSVVIEELGLKQISDSSELEGVVKKIVEDNPNEVERFRGGDKKLTAFFVGQAMKATRGKGNPKEINRLLSELIK